MTSTTLDGSATPFLIPADTIEQANDGDALYALGSIDNQGTIFLNGTGTPSTPPTAAELALLLLASPTVTLGGGGTLLLGDDGSNMIAGTGSVLQTLVNSSDTISGAGQIGVFGPGTLAPGITAEPFALVNGVGGVIDATGTVVGSGPFPTSALMLNSAAIPVVNDGLLEATGVGGLFAVDIDQSGGGRLLASGAGVDVFASTVIGGTVQTIAGGQVVVGALDGSSAAVTIAAGTTLVPNRLLGSIVNRGTLLASSDSGGIQDGGSIVLLSPAVTLTGGGTVELFTDTPAYVHFAGTDAAVHSLVNVDNTIVGYGFIGANAAGSNPATPVSLTNEAQGVIDATGGTAEQQLFLFGAGATLANAGLLEATTNGGLSITDATIDNAGGTLLASGAGASIALDDVSLTGGTLSVSGTGDTVSLQTADVTGTAINATAGGAVEFTAGASTLATGSGTLVVGTGEILGVTGGTLTLPQSTINNAGTLLAGGTLLLVSAATTLEGGGTVQLTGSIATAGAATLVNAGDTIAGGGEISGGALTLTNDAGGVIAGPGLDFAAPARNAGLLENLTVGANMPTTIDNAGGTLLADGGTVTLLDADIAGGTLAAANGGVFGFGSTETIKSNVTLDGSAAPVTIAAGATLQAYIVEISLPFYSNVPTNLTLTGTVDLLGTIQSPYSGEGTPGTLSNAGLLASAGGSIDGSITNNGTLLAQHGLLTVSGNVGGTGSIAIAAGATFELGALSGENVDFRGDGGKLVLDTPSYVGIGGDVPELSGTLANLSYGDAIDLVGAQLTAVHVAGGNTLAVALIGGSTLDYTFSNLQAGDTFKLASATATPEYVYDFTYAGVGGTSDPGTTEQGTGTVTLDTASGTATLADVTGFSLSLVDGSNPDFPAAYTLASLSDFTADIDVGGTITSLSFVATDGMASELGQPVPTYKDLHVTNLGPTGAEVDYNAGAGTTLVTTGSITVTPTGQLLSEVLVACFAEGTRIRTPDGDRQVEALRPGDTVVTLTGIRTVKWIGHRRVACDRHPRPQEVQPVRVRAHAFGPDTPRTDLRLSPDHAVFVRGVLIPVRYLVNGATIVRETVEIITYWHLELETHDALLAENLPCESYLDTGNRGAFVECEDAVLMTADFARGVWDTRSFAPLALAGPAVEATRRDLLHHAEALGYRLSSEPDLSILVDGRTVSPEPGGDRFVLPAGARDIRLISCAGVPAETSVASGDHRRLGVAVATLRADGNAVALDDARLGAGWHAPERGWRWTDGSAGLALPGMRELEIAVAITARYWVTPVRAAITPAAAAS